MKNMEKKLYRAPHLAVVNFESTNVLLTSDSGLTEAAEVNLSGSALAFRRDGSVNIFG